MVWIPIQKSNIIDHCMSLLIVNTPWLLKNTQRSWTVFHVSWLGCCIVIPCVMVRLLHIIPCVMVRLFDIDSVFPAEGCLGFGHILRKKKTTFFTKDVFCRYYSHNFFRKLCCKLVLPFVFSWHLVFLVGVIQEFNSKYKMYMKNLHLRAD